MIGILAQVTQDRYTNNMKTRIVYPQLWLDEKFASCNVTTKLLFCYLINNIQLGLSPYLHITDRQIMFDTGLNSNQLETGKKELSNLNWCYFTDNWVFHNHKCAYINYEGRDRVLQSKQEEIDKVPLKIKDIFNGLVTGYKPVLNHKSKTINHKSKTINQKLENSREYLKKFPLDDFSDIDATDKQIRLEGEKAYNWCLSNGKTKKDYKAFLRNWVLKNYKKKSGTTPTRADDYDIDEKGIARIKDMKEKMLGGNLLKN